MGYRVELADAARQQLAALDREWQLRLAKFLDSLEALEDPAVRFERLHNKLSGLWKHREGHVRMIAHIDRGRVRVLVLKIGRRDEVYDTGKRELQRFAQDIDQS